MPSHTLYEDKDVMVFLDIYPVSKGHCLLISKEHYETIYDIPENETAFLSKLPIIAKRMKEASEATGINILQSNGKDAGQIINHLHFHIIPRFPDDNLIKFPPQSEFREETAKEIIEKFKKYN